MTFVVGSSGEEEAVLNNTTVEPDINRRESTDEYRVPIQNT